MHRANAGKYFAKRLWTRKICPGKQFPLWTGESKKKSVIGNWPRALKKLFKLAKVPNGHGHRFRLNKNKQLKLWRRGEVHYSGALKARNLLILRYAPTARNAQSAKRRYTAGTRNTAPVGLQRPVTPQHYLTTDF